MADQELEFFSKVPPAEGCVLVPAWCASLPERCLAGRSSLSRVTFEIGSALKRIGKDAFRGCNNLREIEIPASVEEIGENCFFQCSSLSRVTFASGSALKRIGRDAFSECTGLEEIEIPASVEELGEVCFSGCSSLSRVTFASGSALKRVGECAFSECKRLMEIEIPAGVEEIGDGCFSGCNVGELRFSGEGGFVVMDSLIVRKNGMCAVCCFRCNEEIEIPAGVEEIGGGCFYDCQSLLRVTFASGSALKRIGKEAFSWCWQLKEIEIPASVEEIGEGCFYSECSDCGNYLTRITFTSGSVLKRIGDNAFMECMSLEEIEIPASVEEIGDSCFYDCRSLSRVTFASDSKLKRIADSAFCECYELHELEIPAGVEVGDIGVSYVNRENGDE